MHPVLEEIQKIGIVPVVVLNDANDAKPLAEALVKGSLPCAEVTFRTAAAEESIQIMTEAYPEMLIGAGTVLTTEQVDRAVAAGAKFIVSPGLNPKTVRYCQEKNIPVVPGVANPSDIEAALDLGLETVKFFPAEALGGLKMIKAMAAPYTSVTFMPTGGINADNIRTYLDFPKILACGGSWMVSAALVKEKKFDEIEALTRQAVNEMLGFELKHVGINCSSEAEADATAKSFEDLFGFGRRPGNTAIFAGSYIECTKTPYMGDKGHIAVGTNDLPRAIAYLARNGYAFAENSEKYDKNGNMTAIYLKEQIGGFAVHLLQK